MDSGELADFYTRLAVLIADLERARADGAGSRELSLAQTKLQEAQHWVREHAELLQINLVPEFRH